MCTFNKPFDWLDSLNPDISRAIVDQAKRRAPEIMKKFRERESQIQQLRLDRIRAKEDKVKAREAKAVKDHLELIGKIDEMGGLWKTEEEMKRGLEQVKESARGEGKREAAREHQMQDQLSPPHPRTARQRSKRLDLQRKWAAAECGVSLNQIGQTYWSNRISY